MHESDGAVDAREQEGQELHVSKGYPGCCGGEVHQQGPCHVGAPGQDAETVEVDRLEGMQ